MDFVLLLRQMPYPRFEVLGLYFWILPV